MTSYQKTAAAVGLLVAFGVPLHSTAAGEAPWRSDAAFEHHKASMQMADARGSTLSGFAVDGLPTRIPGLGTYVGGFGAVRDRGNGNYFAIDGDLARTATIDTRAAKIIQVTPEAARAACSIEHGVCVIRP